jgi:hypothetical protein
VLDFKGKKLLKWAKQINNYEQQYYTKDELATEMNAIRAG